MRLWRPLIDRLVQRFELDFGVASSAEEDREETGDESWEATLAVSHQGGRVDRSDGLVVQRFWGHEQRPVE